MRVVFTVSILFAVLLLLGLLFYTLHSTNRQVYFVGAKAITGEINGNVYTLAQAVYDDTGLRLIVKDRDFNFTQELVVNDRLKDALNAKYSKINYLLYLCKDNVCTGYSVSEQDFNMAELGSLVEAETSNIKAKILRVVELSVKPFYTYSIVEINESRALKVWRKTMEEIKPDIKPPFSGMVIYHVYATGGDFVAGWFVIVTSLGQDAVTNTVVGFDESLRLREVYELKMPRKYIDRYEAERVVESELEKDEYASEGGAIKQIGWYYIYSYPALDFGGTIVVEKHSGVVFFATTVWDGKGKLIVPSKDSLRIESKAEDAV